MSVAVRPGTLIARHSTAAVISDAEMVDRITGSDITPTWANCVSGSPKPSSTTAVCRIFFDANLMPGPAAPFCFQNVPMAMPRKMANTAPPTSGTAWPRNQQTTAIRALTAMPGARVLMRDMGCFLRVSCMARSTIAQRPAAARRPDPNHAKHAGVLRCHLVLSSGGLLGCARPAFAAFGFFGCLLSGSRRLLYGIFRKLAPCDYPERPPVRSRKKPQVS